MKTFQALAVVVLLLSLAACARRDGRGEPRFDPEIAETDPEVYQVGIASWYGADFHGRTTANGEKYDMHKLTAAHPQLPFHTLVEVENRENGKRVLVRINDRGPFVKERIIDLSLKAAQRLEMAEKGTAAVCLRLLRRGGPMPAGAPPPGPPRGCVVQAGAFAVRENAEDLLLTLGDIFPGLGFRVAVEDGMFKVLSPELGEAAACSEVLRKLAAHGLQGFAREPVPGEK
ncbi:MAG: septal ring lytic transglycosylase RlpA family protein [Acidobacteria bacterium]|nr:septal ring lytic transglycosylase RlpA family protein [Acidobacteriota bacterium]